MIRKSTPSSARNSSPCDGVDDISSQGFRGKSESGKNALPGKVRIGFQEVFRRFTGGHLLQDHLHGDASSSDDGFTHHDVRVGDDLGCLASHREAILSFWSTSSDSVSGKAVVGAEKGIARY